MNVVDLGILATNYGTGTTFGQGDFNYDGKIDVADLGTLASNYGKVLAAAPPASAAQSTAGATQNRLDAADSRAVTPMRTAALASAMRRDRAA